MKSLQPAALILRAKRHAAFSLIEVTLAVGLVGFTLAGLLGVLPVALASGRQSVDQGRAASIANTLFALMRDGTQPASTTPFVTGPSFKKVYYLDEQFDPATGMPDPSKGNTLDFSALTTPIGSTPLPTVCYAKFLANAADPNVVTVSSGLDTLGSQRRLCLTGSKPTTGPDYVISLYFDNQPSGMLATGFANRVTIVVSPASYPKDKYRFVSTIASRMN